MSPYRIETVIAALFCLAATASAVVVIGMLAYFLPPGPFAPVCVVFGGIAVLIDGFAAFLAGMLAWDGVRGWCDE